MVGYDIGKKLLYCEDGAAILVSVVENSSNCIEDRYKLKVIEIERESPLWKEHPKKGDILSVFQRKGVAYGGMWTLVDRLD